MRGGMAAALTAAALALAACSGNKTGTAVDPNLAPTDYEREVLNTLRSSLDNPVNVREASISAPALRAVGQEQRYSVCVRYNARDAANQYVGVKEQIGWFYAGHLNQLVDPIPGQCAGAAYRPWPALEQLCQAKKCE
jgi:hypothetical protein